MGIIKPNRGKAASGFGGRAVVKPSFGGGKGGKGGKGGGQWLFVPAAAAPAFNSRFGGGGKAGVGGGKAGKGGKGKQGNDKYKFMDKLDGIDAERKVWVGGLPKDVTRGNIVEHFKTVANPGMFEIMSKGTACVSFKTADDAESAIASLNGSDLNGSEIQVDVWTKKEKKERPKGEKREKQQKTKLGVKTSTLKKGQGKGKVDEKMKEKVRAVDHSLKVWVGGMEATTTWKQLKEHFTTNGIEVDLVGFMKPGTACVTFKTEDEATNALSVSGTELADKTLTVDVWTKPERKEKKAKGAEE